MLYSLIPSACPEAIFVWPEERVQYGSYPVENNLLVDFGYKQAETDASVVAS